MDKREVMFFWIAVVTVASILGFIVMLIILLVFGEVGILEFLKGYGSIIGALIAVGVAYFTIRAQYKNTQIQLKKSKYEEMFTVIQALLHHNHHVESQEGYDQFLLYISKIKMLQALYEPLNTKTYEKYIDSAGDLSASYMENINIEKNKEKHSSELLKNIQDYKTRSLSLFVKRSTLALNNIVHNSKLL